MYTPNVYRYHDVGMDVSSATSLLFEVEACNDAHILLMENAGDEVNDVIEIVIGISFEVIFVCPKQLFEIHRECHNKIRQPIPSPQRKRKRLRKETATSKICKTIALSFPTEVINMLKLIVYLK